MSHEPAGYDRRHLAMTNTPRGVEVRIRQPQGILSGHEYMPELRYTNTLESAYVSCGRMECHAAIMRMADPKGHPGSDPYTGPLYLGEARYLHITELPKEGNPECSHCGNTVR